MRELAEALDWDLKSTKRVVTAIFVTALALVIMAFVFGWISLPFRKGDVQNVEKQFTFGYEQMNALRSTAQSVCFAQAAADAETIPELQAQRITQVLAYQTNYTRLAAGYDAWSQNVFTGKVIRPADLPYTAPTLKDMEAKVCQ